MGRSASSQSVPSLGALERLRVPTIHRRQVKCFPPYDVNSEKLLKIIIYDWFVQKGYFQNVQNVDFFSFSASVFNFVQAGHTTRRSSCSNQLWETTDTRRLSTNSEYANVASDQLPVFCCLTVMGLYQAHTAKATCMNVAWGELGM